MYGFYDAFGAGPISMNEVVFVFKGWYLSEKEIEKVQYYSESRLLGESEYGLKDEVAYLNHPEYKNHNAGFELKFDVGKKFNFLYPQHYNFSVVIIYKDGSSSKLNQQIGLYNMQASY